jgi:hypothetical protein
MSAYDMDSILNKWERGTITTEQAVGQILLLIQALSQRVGHLERRLERKRGSREEQVADKEAKDEAESEKNEAERPSAEPPANS